MPKNWIYDISGSGGAGAVLPAAPGDVTIVTLVETTPKPVDSYGDQFTEYYVEYNPPTPIGTFKGVHVTTEQPANTRLLVPVGPFDYNGDGSTVQPNRHGYFFLRFYPKLSQAWFIYLQSFSDFMTKSLVFHVSGAPGETPGVLVTVTPGNEAASGGVVLPSQATVAGSQPPAGSPPGPQTGTPQFRQRGTSDLLETLIRATITLPSGHSATGVTLYISYDNGATYEETVNDKVGTGPTSDVEFWWPAPLQDTTQAKLKAVSWGPTGWNNPNTAIASSMFTVKAGANIAVNAVTNAAITGGNPGGITYTQSSDGSWLWGFVITWTNPPVTNANFWLTKMTVQKVTPGSGTLDGGTATAAPDSEGVEREVDEFDVPGQAVICATANSWTIPPAGSPYVYRLRIYCVDKLGRPTQQTTAWGGTAAWLQLDPDPKAPAAIIPPPLPTNVSASSTQNRENAYSGALESRIVTLITYPPAGIQPDGVQIYLSRDTGTWQTWEFVSNNVAGALGSVQTITDWVPAPTVTITGAKVKAITFTGVWNDPDQATGGAISLPFQISAGGNIVTGSITDAQIVNTPGSVAGITYMKDTNGVYWWGFTITFTNPADPNFFTTNCFVQEVDGTGVAISGYYGTVRRFADRNGTGLQTVAIDATWGIPAIVTPPHKFRITLTCVNKLNQETAQNGAWLPSHTDYLELTPVEPTGSAGTEYAPWVTLVGSVAATYLNDETGAQIYYLGGILTPTVTDPSYAGCSIQGTPGAAGTALEELDNKPRTPSAGNVNWRSASRPVPSGSETWTLTFLSYRGDGRTNTTGPTATVTVTRQIGGVAGTEYANSVTGFTASVKASYTEGGQIQYHWFGSWIRPATDVRYKGLRIIARAANFQGVANVTVGSNVVTWNSGDYFSPDMAGSATTGKGVTLDGVPFIIGTYVSPTVVNLTANYSGAGTSTGLHNFIVTTAEDEEVYVATELETSFTSPDKPLTFTKQGETFTLYAASMDASNRQNPVANSPNSGPITLTRIGAGSPGREFCDIVSTVVNDTGTANVTTINNVPTEIGEEMWFGSGGFTEPVDPRYGGTRVMRKNPTVGQENQSIIMADIPRSSAAGGAAVHYRGNIQPKTGNPVAIIFLSYDTNGRTNLYASGTTPEITTFPIPAQANTLNLAKVLPGSLVTSAFASTITPVAIISNPEPATGPGTPYPTDSYATNQTTGAFRQASGGAWIQAIDGRTDIIARSVITGTIAVGAVSATEIVTGDLLVGGAGKPNSRIRVDNLSGVMVGFIGDTGSFQGGYFSELRVGPNINPSSTDPIIVASGTIVLIQNVPVTLNNGSLVTTLNFHNAVGATASFSTNNAANNQACVIYTSSISIGHGTGAGAIARAQLVGINGGNSYMGIYAPSGANGVTLLVNTSGAVSSQIGATAGYSGSFTYSKPAGGSGTVTMLAGFIIGVT